MVVISTKYVTKPLLPVIFDVPSRMSYPLNVLVVVEFSTVNNITVHFVALYDSDVTSFVYDTV